MSATILNNTRDGTIGASLFVPVPARELFEETGYRAEGLEHIVSVHTSTGRTDEVCHLFRCRAVRDPGGPRPEPTEFIRVVELPYTEALKGISDGVVTDAATVLGLLWSARLSPNEI